MRSAAGFSFERNDCIPTPRRIKEASDPEGTAADETTLKKKKPYTYDDGHPFARNLQMRDAEAVLETFSTAHQDALDAGRAPWPRRPVLDFRWTRKPSMPAAYKATILAGAVA
jgi:hypothetical protein